MSPPETVNTAPRDTAAASSPIRLLLVEDDDGDALLVEELLAVTGAYVEIVRAATLADARRHSLAEIDHMDHKAARAVLDRELGAMIAEAGGCAT